MRSASKTQSNSARKKPSSNTSSSQAKLIIRVIKRELDDKIDSITFKYKREVSISSINVTA